MPSLINNVSNNLRPVTLCLTRFLPFTFLPKRTLSSPPADAEAHLRLTRIRKINTSHHIPADQMSVDFLKRDGKLDETHAIRKMCHDPVTHTGVATHSEAHMKRAFC